VRCIVTGSSHLDVFRRGGESMMGRYLHYRMHPLSVGELARPEIPRQPIREPVRLPESKFRGLLEHGGYPEPYLTGDRRFSLRWRGLRAEQMLREDVRDLTRIQELGQIEHLGHLLAERSGQSLVLSDVAEDVQVSVDTARRWVAALCGLHWGFLVRPWWRNVKKALRKEPRWYLRDWSACEDPGARAETFVACHLLKAVELWHDLGLGTFELRYLREALKRDNTVTIHSYLALDQGRWLRWGDQSQGPSHLPLSSADLPRATPGLFSFNSPVGACEECRGFGRVIGIDWARVVPDEGITIRRGAVKPFQTASRRARQCKLVRACDDAGVPVDVPWRDLGEEQRAFVLHGDDRRWDGVAGFFAALASSFDASFSLPAACLALLSACFSACWCFF